MKSISAVLLIAIVSILPAPGFAHDAPGIMVCTVNGLFSKPLSGSSFEELWPVAFEGVGYTVESARIRIQQSCFKDLLASKVAPRTVFEKCSEIVKKATCEAAVGYAP